uniref:FUN14 domain containing 1 n=1 Tax=Pan paniscus TaxID=9597 RepID=A0A2R9BC52_PANPA
NPAPQEYESEDDSYEVLDLTEYARRHQWWNPVFGHSSGSVVEKYAVATQIVMGGVPATAVGGDFLAINWKRVEKDANKAKRQMKKRANKAAPEINNLIEEAIEFIKQHIVIPGRFVGGFLLGLAS